MTTTGATTSWKVSGEVLTKAEQVDPILQILYARLVWSWLTPTQHDALLAAYPHGQITCHHSTLRSLRARGLVEGWSLTDAAKLIVGLVKP